MLSKAQKLKMIENLIKVLRELPTSNSIKEISEKTNIPTSNIQRYLNDEKLIEEALNEMKEGNYKEWLLVIRKWLENSKKSGNRRGGRNSQTLHSFLKDEDGKFLGSGKNRK